MRSKGWKGLRPFSKSKERKRRRQKEALQPISGVIMGGNGSHLSHLDIWEKLWLQRREGLAEVSGERVLHRGLWHSSDDMPPLQQWEVKGKNNSVLGERGRCGTAGLVRMLPFLDALTSPGSCCIPTTWGTYGSQWHGYLHTLQGGRRAQACMLHYSLLYNEDSKTKLSSHHGNL